MISVLNHLQQSNGNKFLPVIVLLLLLTGSCNSVKKVPAADKTEKEQELEAITGGKIYDPQTGTFISSGKITPTESLDTIQWSILSKVNFPPIFSTQIIPAETGGNPVQRIRVEQYGSEILSSYNVSLLLPFMTQSFTPDATQFGETSNWALNYYAGSLLALEELDKEGVSINLNVLDTRGSTTELNSLLRGNNELANAHLIIGPYKSELVQPLVDFAGRNNKILVSPNYIPEKPFSNQPNYIQVKPGFKRHCEALVQDALRKYKPEQIVIVARNRAAEIEGVQFIQEEYRRFQGGNIETPLQEYIISLNDDELSVFESIDVLPFISLTDTTVFIMPSWSNESFVYTFLRKLDLSRENDEAVVVYGLPQWMRYERIDFDYYGKMNVHISQNAYMDLLSPQVEAFKTNFFRKYGAVPKPEAFLGYDVMKYFGKMIGKYGTRFQYALESVPETGLNMAFDVERVIDRSSGQTENLPIQQFENKHIYILKFQDYNFVPASRY